MNAKKLARWGSALVLVALLAASCAQPTPAPPVIQTVVVTEVVTEVVPGEPVVETVVVEVTPPPPAVDEARAEQLNIAINGPIADPTNLNIYSPAVSRSNTGLHQMIYEYFFYSNLQTGEFIPWLATDYAYNEDFTSITVNLREGIKWSDGEPFTAEDVIFTYDLLRENPGMTWAAEANKWVESVVADGDLTVTFNLTSPNPRYHQIREAFPAVGIWGGLTILPKHVWEGQDPLTFKSSPPIGTGAYKLSNATNNVITYERRDDWWGTEAFGVTPGPKFVNFMYVGPSTSVAFALADNELDSPNIGILSLSDFLAVKDRNPNLSAWSAEAPYTWLDPCPRAIMVQNATPPWDKKEARWGLSYLIDRQQIADLAYEGTTVPSWGIWPFYDGLQPYFDAISDLRTQYPSDTFDQAKGEEMLTAAGLTKNADGAWTFNGQPVVLDYVVNADSTEEMKVSNVLADQLEAAGFTVNVVPLAGGVLNDTTLRGDYTIRGTQSFCPGFIYDNLELFHSKYFVPLGDPAPWYERNSFRYQNPELDAIIDQMAQTAPDDEATLIQQYQDAMAIWFEDLPVVPLVQAPALVPFTSTYWEGWPNAENPWNMPVSWWATFNLVINGYPDPETGDWVGGIKPAGQ
jgi:peptide/nickel transport system substrate-binding protein